MQPTAKDVQDYLTKAKRAEDIAGTFPDASEFRQNWLNIAEGYWRLAERTAYMQPGNDVAPSF